MMQLLCNGEFLDLPEKATVTFQRTNPLFAFDSIKCERSTGFDIPATSHNNAIFGLSGDYHYQGDGMRMRYPIQYVDGVITRDGYLYITDYAKGVYKCVIILGELVGLKMLTESKIADLVGGEYVTYGDIPYDADEDVVRTLAWANVNYNGGDIVRPSWSLGLVINQCMATLGISWQHVPALDAFRVIAGDTARMGAYNGKMVSQPPLMMTRVNMVQPTLLHPDLIDTAVVHAYEYHTEAIPDGQGYFTEDTVIDIYKDVQFFKAKKDIMLTFPESTPSTFRLCRGSLPLNANIHPLAGRSFTFRAGDTFLLFVDGDIVTQQTGGPYYEREGGFFYTERYTLPLASKLFYSVEVVIEPSQTGDIQVGEYCYLRDNLPDLTVVDLLKVAATLQGFVLDYTDADGVTFQEIYPSTWPRIQITLPIEVSSVTRKFADYAQRNIVSFASADDVYDTAKVTRVYNVYNTNIAEVKTLQEIPFSEGNTDMDGDIRIVTHTEGANTIGECGQSAFLTKITIPRCDGIANLCDRSTTILLTARMSNIEYMSITPETVIYYDGCDWVWTESQYSNGLAKFTLSKV